MTGQHDIAAGITMATLLTQTLCLQAHSIFVSTKEKAEYLNGGPKKGSRQYGLKQVHDNSVKAKEIALDTQEQEKEMRKSLDTTTNEMKVMLKKLKDNTAPN